MAEVSKMHLAFERFAAGFLYPLMAGGTAEVGRPLGPGCLDHFANARSADLEADRETYDAIHAIANGLAPVGQVPYPDRGTTALAIACHDLLALTDPKMDRVFSRRARPVILGWVDALVEAAGPPHTRAEALSRHAVVSRTLGMSREDVVVKNWAYTYRFFGRPVPHRVVAMPRLRFVKQFPSEKKVLTLIEGLDKDTELPVEPTLTKLLSRTPVTELLRYDLVKTLRFGGANIAVLSDPAIRYGIARELVARGLDYFDEPIGDALWALANAKPPPAVLYYALAFVLELVVADTLNARGEPRPLRHETPQAALFGAILPAVLGSPCALDPLVDLAGPDMHKLRRRAEAHDRAIQPEIIRVAISLVGLARQPAARSAVEVRP